MESERQTRRRRIDPRLRAAGWEVVSVERYGGFTATPVAVEEFPTPSGPADYALFVDDHAVGVVEAKKVTLGPQGVLAQAERYARGIDQTPLARRIRRAVLVRDER
jgi:type I restriction enzyme, R subunit